MAVYYLKIVLSGASIIQMNSNQIIYGHLCGGHCRNRKHFDLLRMKNVQTNVT